jgi:DNA polymerase-3 subunit delta'
MTWDILGHEWAADLLAAHAAAGQERHAYLFAGPAGIGRRTLALRFAQALNCPQPAAPGQPCRTCNTCQRIEKMQHADLLVVQADQEGGVLKVDQIRTLLHHLSLAPYAARYKIGLLLRFQEAHPSAANALLKTLEEPTSRVILLLTADSPEALLPTIVSRCEVLRLRPMPVERLKEHLQVSRGLDPVQAARLAHLAGGRPGRAVQLIGSPQLVARHQELVREGLRLMGESRRSRFTAAAKAAEDRETLRQALLAWSSLWRDVLLCAAQAESPALQENGGMALTNLDEEVSIRQAASRIGLEAARRGLQALEKARQLQEANANPRLLAEVTLLDWPRV